MESSLPVVFGVSSFCVITGASRGIGRSIAVNISKKLGGNSLVVITARNTERLAETKRLIECSSPAVHVKIVAGELGNSTALNTLIDLIFNDVKPSEFQHAILIHNAGTLGDVTKKIIDLNDAEELQRHHFENVTSAHLLTSRFLNVFKGVEGLRRTTIVQMTSDSSVIPSPSMSLYCSSKAARDMLFAVLAKEEPNIKVLSYDPGPIDTAMFRTVLDDTCDDQFRGFLNEMYDRSMVNVEDTVAGLLGTLELDNFTSGARFSYYDVAENVKTS